MDNPYQQKQAQLLQRIVSNTVKCNEAISLVNEVMQNIVAANAEAEAAAEIFAYYREVVHRSIPTAEASMNSEKPSA
ncbi:hypothetical protein PIIN_04256 [Serendipita indica DSM 11827]|uniref:DASH complex subunit DAD4 n=1 Tax=Serendipita indica (strain DSM 11827) TaxID=1109443 RepID=G4TG74_SERID|nr:hypothetical protein PIIN_04256 [Serendipita indica DSM 11827]